MGKLITIKLLIIFIFLSENNLLFSQEESSYLLKKLVSMDRLFDAMTLSLVNVESKCGSNISCKKSNLRNAARASLLMGDYSGAQDFIALSIQFGVCETDKVLKNYIKILDSSSSNLIENYNDSEKILYAIDGKHSTEKTIQILQSQYEKTENFELKSYINNYLETPTKSPLLAGLF